MMRKYLVPAFLVIMLMFFASVVKAQSTIPPFQIMLSNGTYFSGKALPKGKPVILIYFQPDCEHCEKLMDALFKKIKEFRNTDIVMVTFKPVDELPGFEQKYQTYKYPNIIVGTEGTTYYLRYYYKLETTPFTALFDKKGKLIYSYRKETPVNDLISRLKKLTSPQSSPKRVAVGKHSNK